MLKSPQSRAHVFLTFRAILRLHAFHIYHAKYAVLLYTGPRVPYAENFHRWQARPTTSADHAVFSLSADSVTTHGCHGDEWPRLAGVAVSPRTVHGASHEMRSGRSPRRRRRSPLPLPSVLLSLLLLSLLLVTGCAGLPQQTATDGGELKTSRALSACLV